MVRIKQFDFFGFTPTFRIDGKDELKSFIGGLFTIIFLIISIGYLIYSVINYLNTLESIATSRQIYSNSKNYTLNLKDVSYGIAVFDKNNKLINLTDHPYLEIYSEYRGQKFNSENFSISPIELIFCDRELFIPNLDFSLYKTSLQKTIKETLEYYTCFDINQGIYLEPSTFSGNSYSLNLYLRLKQNINLENASKWINNVKPNINLIYQDYLIDGNHKYKPFVQKINTFSNNIDFYFNAFTEIKINPYNILDDVNPFASGNYIGLDVHQYSAQSDGTVFLSQRNADYFSYFPNREIINYSDSNLVEIRLVLASLATSTLRTYRKFNDFVASVTSIISNLFLVFAVITSKLNQIKGINNMVKSLFSLDQIQTIKEFKQRFQKISDKVFIYEKKGKRKKLKKYFTSTFNNNDIKDELIITNNERNTLRQTQIGLRRAKTNFEKKLEELFEENIKLNLKEYIRFKYLCIRRTSDKVLENAIKYVEDMLDINSYMKFKLEIDMLKDVILDKNQKSAFDIMSTILNFNKLFQYENYVPRAVNIKEFVEENIEDILNPLMKVVFRKNETDGKILNFLKKVINSK